MKCNCCTAHFFQHKLSILFFALLFRFNQKISKQQKIGNISDVNDEKTTFSSSSSPSLPVASKSSSAAAATSVHSFQNVPSLSLNNLLNSSTVQAACVSSKYKSTWEHVTMSLVGQKMALLLFAARFTSQANISVRM